jgi:hypothetical protein
MRQQQSQLPQGGGLERWVNQKGSVAVLGCIACMLGACIGFGGAFGWPNICVAHNNTPVVGVGTCLQLLPAVSHGGDGTYVQ